MSNTETSSVAPPGNLLDLPVRPVSLVNDVADRFRRSIVNGTLKPGAEINESQLSERLNVSRGTLREAVRILIGEGLLEKLPNRTSRVRCLTVEKAWEITTARAVIEGFAARVLAERLTGEKLARLQAMWEQLHNAAVAGDPRRFRDSDFNLHQAIMEMSSHEVLYETWIKMSAWIRLMFAALEYTPEQMLDNARKHQDIIKAIATGNPDVAEYRLKTDLLAQSEFTGADGFESLADYLSRLGAQQALQGQGRKEVGHA